MSDPGPAWRVRRPDGSVSAEFYGADAEANAKFSAAAADLYEVLKEMISHFRMLPDDLTEPGSVMGRAEAAIAKAEGRR